MSPVVIALAIVVGFGATTIGRPGEGKSPTIDRWLGFPGSTAKPTVYFNSTIRRESVNTRPSVVVARTS